MSTLKLGRLQPTNAPALRLAPLLTGTVPAHPASVDYLGLGGWQMLGNDQYGDCVAVTWGNVRRLMTHQAGKEHYPALDEVLALYKTQNPNFPTDDNGMVIQTCLEYLVHAGGPDGVKALAFAKVDHTNADEVKAAIALFGFVWVGINVQTANMDQFNSNQPWDYVSGSKNEGGHSVIAGGYDSDGQGADERFITWAQETGFTDNFWKNLVEEAWVVVWPEHLNDRQFIQGVDLQTLSQDYRTLTGRDFPVPVPSPIPPTPAPTPAPTPGAAPFPGADLAVAARIGTAAARAKLSPAAWLNKHFDTYFKIPTAGEVHDE